MINSTFIDFFSSSIILHAIHTLQILINKHSISRRASRNRSQFNKVAHVEVSLEVIEKRLKDVAESLKKATQSNAFTSLKALV